MAVLLENERFGSLVVVAPVTTPDDEDQKYRVRCLKSSSDCVLASEDTLLAGRVAQCFDCSTLAKMTDAQRALAAFRRSLDLTPEQEELDRVDSFPETSAPLSIAQAIAA